MTLSRRSFLGRAVAAIAALLPVGRLEAARRELEESRVIRAEWSQLRILTEGEFARRDAAASPLPVVIDDGVVTDTELINCVPGSIFRIDPRESPLAALDSARWSPEQIQDTIREWDES